MAKPSNIWGEFLFLAARGHGGDGAPENYNYNFVLARRKIIIFLNFEIFGFLMFFSAGIGSGPSWMAPWTPWIDRKIQKKISKNLFFGIFFILDPWPAIIDHLDL